ncbi:MAG: Flagellar motor switch protein FliN [Alphaproteobacteria bacterium MarineAlpha4_Bin2]|nr:MAG: Flagellar motor switch protein FliN [Alphaproteobacteria bacterium MarineAlpha4_Bin2]
MADDDNLELNELESETPEPPLAEGDDMDTMDDLDPGLPQGAQDLEAVYDIPVQVSAVLGKSSMQVSQLLKLGRGAVVELDRKVGEAIDIYVNNRLVARGEVVVVENKLGVTMTEIIKSDQN